MQKTYKSIYQTSDLNLAAYIMTQGFQLHESKQLGPITFFSFLIDDDLNPHNEYLNGALVSAKDFASAQKDLKRLCFIRKDK